MSAPLAITDTVGRVDAAVSGQSGGQRFPLGMTFDVPAVQSERKLYAVNSDGTVEAASLVGPRLYSLAAGEAWVVQPANVGKQRWIYVYNDSGSTIERGAACMRKLATAGYHVAASSGAISPQRIVGFAQHDIPTGSWGWILREGIGSVLCDGNVTVDLALTPDANAGQLTDVAAVTGAAVAIALATDAGAGTIVLARIKCVG